MDGVRVGVFDGVGEDVVTCTTMATGSDGRVGSERPDARVHGHGGLVCRDLHSSTAPIEAGPAASRLTCVDDGLGVCDGVMEPDTDAVGVEDGVGK
jgi:hypothetical protein